MDPISKALHSRTFSQLLIPSKPAMMGRLKTLRRRTLLGFGGKLLNSQGLKIHGWNTPTVEVDGSNDFPKIHWVIFRFQPFILFFETVYEMVSWNLALFNAVKFYWLFLVELRSELPISKTLQCVCFM